MSERFSKPSVSRSREDRLTPSTAAYRLTHVLNEVSRIHNLDRFPVDVHALALETGNIFHWKDCITEIRAEDLNTFEGALFPNDDRNKWMLLYNKSIRSPGRIRFTQAHELGHYILHRTLRDSFQCSGLDMIDLNQDEVSLESQADSFASTLLMPLDDFRSQLGNESSFEAIQSCADRYGVSLTAATLRWLQYTDVNAVLVVHRDGYMLWAVASKSASRSGAFFRTRSQTIPIPNRSLAANHSLDTELVGQELDAQVWYPHAALGTSLREMKICADHYDFVMTLLVLPRTASVWKPWNER